jgi:hypothetical protein
VATKTVVFRNDSVAVIDITAVADADATVTLTNGTDYTFRGSDGANAAPQEVQYTRLVIGGETLAKLDQWGATTINATNVILSKLVGAGSGACASIRVTLRHWQV